MAIEFTMPKLGLTMEEGTIREWLAADGVVVIEGAPVLRIETDKVETEVEMPATGRLHIVARVDDVFACGQRIGWILADGEEAPNAPTSATQTPTSATQTPTSATQAPTSATHAPPTAPTPGVGSARGALDPQPSAAPMGSRLLASPNARRIAAERGIEIGTVTGSGPNGRIVSEDVESHVVGSLSAAKPPATPARKGTAPSATFAAAELARLVGIDLASTAIVATAADGRLSRQDVIDHIRSRLAATGETRPAASFAALTQVPTQTIPMRAMRGTIAARMSASLREMAQLTLTMDAEMDAVVADREARKTSSGKTPGYTDYVIAATARALRDHPIVNSQMTADGIAVLPRINVGMAVALDDGLVVPVVHDTDLVSLDALGERTTALAEAARASKLKLADLEGSTFSVTALGSFGVDAFTPVINPPNAAILGVGRLRDEVVWRSDETIGRARRLTLSLTWDHRVLDGAPAAEFVRTICRYLDDPSTLD